MPNAVIKITRGNEYVGMGRKLKVFIDNTYIGNVGWNETSVFPVTTGQHSIYVKMDWCRSAPISVEIEDGGAIEFEVMSPSAVTAVMASLFKAAHFFRLKKR